MFIIGDDIMKFKVLKAKLRGNQYIVLCNLPENTVTPWVTWIATTANGDDVHCGHYFYENEEARAHADFDAR